MEVKTFFFSAEGIFAVYVVQTKLWISFNVHGGRAQRASTDLLTRLYGCTDARDAMALAVFEKQKSCGSVIPSPQAKLCHGNTGIFSYNISIAQI